VIFTGAGQSSQRAVTYTGGGGPLNQPDHNDAVNGMKPQRRILPGSLVVTATLAGNEVTASDATITTGNTGTITGTGVGITVTGTINYVTGAINVTYAGDAPDNATAVIVEYKYLKPLGLGDPVRGRVGGKEYALRLL
jgi:hypothetical protein